MPDLNLSLTMVKTRLNRLPSDTSLDEYLTARISAAQGELNQMLKTDLNASTADLMLLVDFTVWSYQNRDQSGAQPEWLRMRLRERFLRG